MPVFKGGPVGLPVFGVAVTLVAALAASPAHAQAARQKRMMELPPLEQPAEHLRGTLGTTTPHKFFSINGVLAKQAREQQTQQQPGATPASLPVAPIDPADTKNPFGVVAFRAPEGQLWVKWRKLENDITREAEALKRCRADADACTREASRFQALVAKAQALSGRTRLEGISHAVNGMVRYVSDQAQHGTPDLWSAPLATLASGMGDCEDYAILKYQILREVGMARDDLRIVLLQDTLSRQPHAVLAARADGRWYILDNMYRGFAEDRAMTHYMPLFVLDHEGVKLLATRYASRPLHDSEMVETPVANPPRVAEATPVLDGNVTLRGSVDTAPAAEENADQLTTGALSLRASVM